MPSQSSKSAMLKFLGPTLLNSLPAYVSGRKFLCGLNDMEGLTIDAMSLCPPGYECDWKKWDDNCDGSKLGEGAFGTVRKAKRKEDGKCVAIKIARLGVKRDSDPKKEAIRTWGGNDLIRGLGNHCENLAQVYEMFSVSENRGETRVHNFICDKPSHLIVVMETHEHTLDLFEYWKMLSSTFANSEDQEFNDILSHMFSNIMLPVSSGLSFLHGRNLLLRDVKPANVVVSFDEKPDNSNVRSVKVGHVMLVDYDLAICLNGGVPDSQGGLLGTGHYLSPEMTLFNASYPTSDVFALGVMLYQLAEHKVSCPPWSTHPFFADSENFMSSTLALKIGLAASRKQEILINFNRLRSDSFEVFRDNMCVVLSIDPNSRSTPSVVTDAIRAFALKLAGTGSARAEVVYTPSKSGTTSSMMMASTCSPPSGLDEEATSTRSSSPTSNMETTLAPARLSQTQLKLPVVQQQQLRSPSPPGQMNLGRRNRTPVELAIGSGTSGRYLHSTAAHLPEQVRQRLQRCRTQSPSVVKRSISLAKAAATDHSQSSKTQALAPLRLPPHRERTRFKKIGHGPGVKY